jgi:N-acetylglucosamine-6-phosphate deacetylase
LKEDPKVAEVPKRQWLFGRVATPWEVFDRGAVGWQGDRLFYVGPAEGASTFPNDSVKQVTGWITPGMIDLHLHGAGGYNLMDGDPHLALQGVSRILVEHGVTAFLATSMVKREIPANRHLAAVAEAVAHCGFGAEVLGIHVEGPFVNPLRGGLIRSDRIWPPDTEDLKKILDVSHRRLRMMTLAPELPGALTLLPILTEQGAVASMGHTEADFHAACAGFEHGIRHVTHLYNAMRGLHHREPGALGAALMDHGVTSQIIADGVHVHPKLLAWTARVVSPDALVLITDALPAAGLPDGVYEYDGRPYHCEGGTAWYRGESDLYSSGRIEEEAKGRLFGTCLLLDEMVRRAIRFMGVSFPQAVGMATATPARTLGLEKERGILEPGRLADLVIWNESWIVEETIVHGKTVWRRIEVGDASVSP